MVRLVLPDGQTRHHQAGAQHPIAHMNLICLQSHIKIMADHLPVSSTPHCCCSCAQDKDRMYTTGSLFYAIYFFVSFPMFYRMDESPKQQWSLQQAVLDSLAATMLVTCLLDFWRLCLGAIWEQPVGRSESRAGTGLPWLPS